MLYRVEVRSHVHSVRVEGCVTGPACLSHYCVPQDTTVLLDPLLLNYALRSVSSLCTKLSMSIF